MKQNLFLLSSRFRRGSRYDSSNCFSSNSEIFKVYRVQVEDDIVQDVFPTTGHLHTYSWIFLDWNDMNPHFKFDD